jgi:two-component system cell cycle sensor histidine kinase/response regulator CckA
MKPSDKRTTPPKKKGGISGPPTDIRYKTLFEQSPYGVLLIDTRGKILDFNEAAHRQLGYSRKEFEGLGISDIDPFQSPEEIRHSIEEVLKKGTAEFEVKHRTKGGETRDVHIITRALVVTGETVFHTIWRDITAQKRAEEALRQSERRFHALFDSTPLGVVVVDIDRRIVDCNAAFQKMLGYSLKELRAMSIPEISHPDDDLATRAYYRRMMAGERDSFTMEKRHIRKDGTVFWTNLTGAVLRDEEGKPQLVFGIVEDITERKKTEQALRLGARRLNEAQKIAHVGNWEWDISTNQVFWSDELYRIYGYRPHEMSPDYGLIVESMHPDSRQDFLHAIDAALTEDRPFEMDYAFFRKDGSTAVLHTIGRVTRDPGGKPVRMAGIVQDITEQKRALDALRDSEKKFRSIFDNAKDGILIASVATRKFIAANKTICDMLGYTVEELLGLGVEDIHPPEEIARAREDFALQMRGVKGIAENLKVIRKDGGIFYADISATPISFGGEQYAMGIFRDITERKKMEEALRSSRDFIERILDTVDEAFIVIDRDYRIVMANSAYGSQVRMPAQEIIGKHCYEISHQREMPCYEAGEECAVRHCFETGEPHSCVHKHTDKDGSVLYVETKAFPLRDAAGSVTSAIEVINNITDRHLLEEQILRTQKLEAVGLLAGGIAHDFNNLLQGVFGSISMAKMFSDEGGKAYAMLEGAEAALYQATHLTKQLLTFSRGGEPVKKVIALASVIDHAVRFALSGSNVNYLSSIDERLWTVEADEGQINQVVHNIVLNACEAMPVGGTLRVAMHNTEIGEKNTLPLDRGNYVRIDITDSGPGIPDHYLARIFDPYFTTKQKGSGLGLATSYSIVKRHGGLITVSSQLGTGSTFSLYLPASGQRPSARKGQVAGLLSGRGKILVMDDEEVVRTIAGHMLAGLGYEVEFAESGEGAIEKYSAAMKADVPFDAVILDLTVRGGMGGRETIRKLSAIDPSVKAIVSSGYSSDDILSQYRDYGFLAVLTKPYQIEELGLVLHGLLRTRRFS